MVYRFKIVSDEVDNFCREIEIDSDANFLELRNAILDSVGYTKDEMSSFFLCDEAWQKCEEITLEDMGSSSDEDIWIMEDTHINELVEEEGQRLIFVFDYLTERSFFMELKSIITGKTLMDPLCTRKEGKAPNQHVDLDEFDARMDKKAAAALEDFDADFYGDTEFNEEELGEGFDDLTFN
ncbi:MAG: hypothetical protein II308_05000 [Muribaculaceae bacterium]|jgi:hypothetical protein|nr:hypothetical protein [Muribaculaceae bacterium]MBO7164615.1 hypothetical protein [Muribaculaceae bacterium]MBQ1184951.1 hypothetical protein [Muribaculaceae bacterium]MBQ2399410.1 hypothetical protein [Muribaculaceae bacterium]MBQ2439625.1 hypothetical protein [Muribaculaceae bacterium]